MIMEKKNLTEKEIPVWLNFAEDSTNRAEFYLIKAIDAIDKQFGEGYAKEHPELIDSFMKVSAKNSTFLYEIKDYGIPYKDSDFG